MNTLHRFNFWKALNLQFFYRTRTRIFTRFLMRPTFLWLQQTTRKEEEYSDEQGKMMTNISILHALKIKETLPTRITCACQGFYKNVMYHFAWHRTIKILVLSVCSRKLTKKYLTLSDKGSHESLEKRVCKEIKTDCL